MDGTKQFIVQYEILANVEKALGPLKEFERVVNNLYNNTERLDEKKGLSRINEELNSTIGRIATIREEFNKIQPSFNLNPLRENLKTMERMVYESAKHMQTVLQTALSGSGAALPTNDRSTLKKDRMLIDNYLDEIGRVENVIAEKKKKLNSMLPPDGEFKGRSQGTILTLYGHPKDTEEYKQIEREIAHQEGYLEELNKRQSEARKRYNTVAKQMGLPFLPNDLMTPKQWKNLQEVGSKLGITEQKKLIEQYTKEVDDAKQAVKTAKSAYMDYLQQFVGADGLVDTHDLLHDDDEKKELAKQRKAIKYYNDILKAQKEYKKAQSKLAKASDKVPKEKVEAQRKIRVDYLRELREALLGPPLENVDLESATIPQELTDKAGKIPELKKTYENARRIAFTKAKETLGRLKRPVSYTRPGFLNDNLLSLFKKYEEAQAEYASIEKSIKGGGNETSEEYQHKRANFGNGFGKTDANSEINFIKQQAELESALIKSVEAKKAVMQAAGITERQFDNAFKQYKGYSLYDKDLEEYQRKRGNLKSGFRKTNAYQEFVTARQQLNDAISAQRQVENLKAQMAAAASAPVIGTAAKTAGGLPSILGVNPQVLEQAFTGKLTLVPDIAGAKTLIAAETFNANLRLIPLLEEVQTKLNSKVFTVDIAPKIAQTNGKGKGSSKTSAIGALQQEIDQLKQSANGASLTVGTQLDRSGLLGRAQSGYNTLQELAKRHPITYRLAHDGSGGFDLNRALRSLTEIAKTRPVTFRMTHDGSGGFELNQALTRLTEIAKTRPVPFRMISDGSGGFELNQALARLTNLAKSRVVPFTMKGVLAANNTVDVKSVKPTGVVNVPLKGTLYKKNITPPSAPIEVKVAAKIAGGNNKNFGLNVNTLGLDSKVSQIERLREVWGKLPRTGSRTYTVNLKTTGLENIGRLEQLLALVSKMPPSDRRIYNISSRGMDETQRRTAGNGGYVGPGSSRRSPIYTKKASDDFYSSARRWAYPFTGNTSFGARTPAALDMMKGMGVMMGVGGAMGVIGGGFSEAVNYQNTMETAKAILRDNYKGSNFNADYDDMVRVVRDVAMRTKFTAPEAADAARFMAMAGLNIPAIKGAIAPIADVAAISDTDLGMVADKMTNIMTEFKVKPENMRNLADMMTKTFTSTNTDMMMLAESLRYAGPMAFASGQSLAETLAMIGIMGNSGIQASMAGTTMRMMLQNIYNPNKNQRKFMDSIGLKTRDANGNRRSLFEILKDVSAITGKGDEKNVVGNLLSGKDEKNNIDTFEAASKLFRVTASAGGASLLANIDKVAELAAQIQGASGNSAAVSIAKQNTVAGMWAQAKSAFTEAVVKVFEDNDMQKYIKDTLGGIIEYLKQPEFIKTLKDVFDLVKAIGEVLGWFVKQWVNLYQTFPNITKWVMIGQMALTQIGYLMAPFIGFLGTISSLLAPFKGIGGVGAAASGAALAGRGISSALLANGMAISAINMAATGVAPHTPRTMAMDAIINGGYLSLSAKKRAHAIRAGRYAGMMERLEANNGSMSAYYRAKRGYEYESAMIATIASAQAQYAFERRKLTRPQMLKNTDFLYRAARQNRLSWGNLWKGRGAMYNAGVNAMSLTNLFGGLRSALQTGVMGLIKGFGMLTSPLGLAGLAIGTFATTVYFAHRKIQRGIDEFNNKVKGGREQREIANKYANYEQIKLIGDSAVIDLKNTTAERVAKEYEGLKTNPLLKNLKGVSDVFDARRSEHRGIYNKAMFNEHIAPMSKFLFGRQMTFEELSKGDWSNVGSSIGGYGIYGVNPYADSYVKKFNKYAQQAAVLQTAFQDPRVVREFEQIDKWIADWRKQPVEKQLATRNALMNKIKSIRDKHNQWVDGKTEHLFDLPDLSNIRSGRALYSYEGSKAIWDMLNDIVSDSSDNKYAQIFAASNAFSKDITTRNQAISRLLGFAGSLQFKGQDGQVHDVQLLFNGLAPYWQQLYAQFDKLGIQYDNTEQERKSILLQVFERLSNIPGLAEILSNVIDINAKVNYDPRNYLAEMSYLFPWMNPQQGQNEPEKPLSNIPDGIVAPTPKKSLLGGAWNIEEPKTPMDNYISPEWRKREVENEKKNAVSPLSLVGNNNGNNKPVVSKPIARVENPNKGYESSYSGGAARPTQVIVNIDKLMNTDKMMIASSAEERQLADMMDSKVEQALDILKSQIMMSLQSGSYGIS